MDRTYTGFTRSNTLLLELYDRLTGQYEDPWIEERVFYQLLDGKKVDKNVLSARQWYFVLRRLKERKILENQKIGDRLLIRLSNDGRRRAMILKCQTAQTHYPVGQGCVVVYDIPESERLARKQFRALLKQCSFRMFQRSIWVCRKNVAPTIVSFVKELRLQQWVEVIEGRVLT